MANDAVNFANADSQKTAFSHLFRLIGTYLVGKDRFQVSAYLVAPFSRQLLGKATLNKNRIEYITVVWMICVVGAIAMLRRNNTDPLQNWHPVYSMTKKELATICFSSYQRCLFLVICCFGFPSLKK